MERRGAAGRANDEAAAGSIREADYSPEFWKKAVRSAQQQIRSDLQRLGPLVSLALVERRDEAGLRSYRYIVDFTKARALGRYIIQPDDKVALLQSEAVELKPGMAFESN